MPRMLGMSMLPKKVCLKLEVLTDQLSTQNCSSFADHKSSLLYISCGLMTTQIESLSKGKIERISPLKHK